MKIKQIDRRKFNQLLPRHRALEHLLGTELDWFANPAKTRLGTIALSVEHGWTYAALRPNRLGRFNVSHVGRNIFNYYQTKAELFSAMN